MREFVCFYRVWVVLIDKRWVVLVIVFYIIVKRNLLDNNRFIKGSKLINSG